jgi:hypothetical protein
VVDSFAFWVGGGGRFFLPACNLWGCNGKVMFIKKNSDNCWEAHSLKFVAPSKFIGM